VVCYLGVAPLLVTLALEPESADWRMVGDLFGQKLVLGCNQLESFSQNWVKRLQLTTNSTCIVGDLEHSYICQSLKRVLLLECLLHKIFILHLLSSLLQQT
jgi:hypothetical protein